METGTVRSVERALAIVELLGEHQALGLEELHYLASAQGHGVAHVADLAGAGLGLSGPE